MALIRLKMAVFAPMPGAKEITATAVKPALFCIKRNANRTSCESMVALYAGAKGQSTILEAEHVEKVGVSLRSKRLQNPSNSIGGNSCLSAISGSTLVALRAGISLAMKATMANTRTIRTIFSTFLI